MGAFLEEEERGIKADLCLLWQMHFPCCQCINCLCKVTVRLLNFTQTIWGALAGCVQYILESAWVGYGVFTLLWGAFAWVGTCQFYRFVLFFPRSGLVTFGSYGILGSFTINSSCLKSWGFRDFIYLFIVKPKFLLTQVLRC